MLTALDLEYAAVRAHLTGLSTHTDANGTRYETGQSATGRCRVALALTGPGNLAAAALTTRAVAWFRPKALILVGVAGGLADGVALGDVVVATRVHAYHGGRADSSGFRPRPKSWPLAHGLEQEARDVARGGAWTHLLPRDTAVPAVHFKPLVSGEVVLDTGDGMIATLIRQHYNDAAAIDMESAGVAEAAHHSDFHQTITVRAVSDLADGNKRHTDATGWQHRAVTHAAAFAMALAERIAAGPGSTRPVGAAPYRGLAAFRESDAELFFGRTETAAELAALVSARRFVTVVGRSGSGKSSLVNAGLIPRMRDQGWAIATFRPLPGVPAAVTLAGAVLPLLRPGLGRTEALPHRAVVADAIARGRLAEVVGDVLTATGRSRVLVCVDQFEELVAWSEEAAGELAGLLVWLATGPAAVNVVLTVRAETLDVAVHRLGLGEVTRNSVFLLTPMTAGQLRDAVEGPVRPTGVTFEPGLVARILEAARDAPAALTLTQFALTRLWDEQDHGRLTHHAFDSFGGVGGALASYAEHVWAQRLDETQRGQARRLLVQLVRPGGDGTTPGETIVRRTARGGELAPELIPLAMHLATTRLLVTGTDETGEITVDLAHAALATHWQRLRGWLAEERDFRAWQEDLRENVRRAEPLRGARLVTASRWLRTHPHGIPGPEREFVLASRRRHRLRTAAWRGLLAVIVVLLVAASTFAVNLRQRTGQLADELSRNAAQLLVAEAEERVSTEPEMAALLSVAAYRSSQEPRVLANLAAEYLRYRSTDRVLNPGVGEVVDVAVSTDGRTVAAAGAGGAAVLRLDRKTPATERYGQDMGRVALSGDGRLLATATNRGRIELREPDGEVRRLHDENQADRLPSALRFDDRGERLLAVLVGELMVWDLASGKTLPVPSGAAAAAEDDLYGNVWFGPDGSSIVTPVPEGLAIWPLNDAPAQVIPLPEPSNVLVSGDGRTAVTCAGETLVYWDLATTRERERQQVADLSCPSPDKSALDHHGRILTTQTFREADSHARDARMLLNSAAGGPARFVVPGPVAGHSIAPGLATTDDGSRLVTAAGSAVNVVDVASADFVPMNGADHSTPLLSPDQRYLLTDDYLTSQTLRLWDTATGASLASAPVRGYLIPVGFVGGGSHVLAVDEEINYVALFAVPSLRVVAEIELPAEMRKNSRRLKFDNFCASDLLGADEIAVVHAGLVVRLDLRSGATSGPPLRLWRTENELRLIADLHSCADRPGRAEIAFDVGSRVEVWDLHRGEKVTLPIDDVGRISDLRFSQDGRQLAVIGVNGSLVVWDVELRRPITRPQRVIAGDFPGVAGFPAADRVVVSDLNGLRVWDVDRKAVIADIEMLNAGTATVAPDGHSLTYWSPAGLNRIPLDPRRWADHLCRVVGRDLTDAERGALPPGSHPGRIC